MTETAFVRAFERQDKASAAILQLALTIGRGAKGHDFLNSDSDTRIRNAVRELHESRYEADVALCSFMRQEPYQPRPTQPAKAVEMQARVLRNERVTPRLPSDAGLAGPGVP